MLKMKSLRESLLDDDLITKTDKMIKDEIKAFLKANYMGISLCKISKNPNSNGKYEVSSAKNIEVKNYNITSLTNWSFIWIEVGGDFNCSGCSYLKSLEGAPEKVGDGFDCSYCESLTSLEGAPKEVGDDFNCNNCDSLKSLDGAPKKVGGNFFCRACKIQFTEDDVKKVSNVKGQINA